MSDSDNLILKMLVEMRAEVRATNERIDRSSAHTNARIDHAIATLRGDVAAVSAELTAVELRGASRDIELIASSRNLSKMLEDRFELRDRVERIESEVEVLKRKVG